jgi:GrpB-like predicted nucleotidyltransferase (UPF0157 family)/predicted amidohydrolase
MTSSAEFVKIALIQSPSQMGASDVNLVRFERQCRIAAANGAKILILPEAAISGYLSEDLRYNWHITRRPLDRSFLPLDLISSGVAESSFGPVVQHFEQLARELSVYITVPFIEEVKSFSGSNGSDGRSFFYNSVSLVGPANCGGGVLAHYRKNCPYPHPEQSWATPGDSVEDATYDTEYGRVGLAVCFDIHTILEKYKSKNLWALLYSIAWVGNTQLWFQQELPARLSRVKCPFYILGANWATRAPASWVGVGGSSVYGPGGVVLAAADVESSQVWRECIVYCDIPTQQSRDHHMLLCAHSSAGKHVTPEVMSAVLLVHVDGEGAAGDIGFDSEGYCTTWRDREGGTDYWSSGPGKALVDSEGSPQEPALKHLVAVVGYNGEWPRLFDTLRHVLWEEVGSFAQSIEHVGSTSVPGLAAKPIIDIDIIVNTWDNYSSIAAALGRLGYTGQGDCGIPDRKVFSSSKHFTNIPHNLYVCLADSLALKNHMAFRNFLRNNPDKVVEYGSLKRSLSIEHRFNISKYCEAKTDFVIGCLGVCEEIEDKEYQLREIAVLNTSDDRKRRRT